MVVVRFPDAETERKALGKLIGRFSFKTWDNGVTMVPEPALVFLASEGFSFTVEHPACYRCD